MNETTSTMHFPWLLFLILAIIKISSSQLISRTDLTNEKCLEIKLYNTIELQCPPGGGSDSAVIHIDKQYPKTEIKIECHFMTKFNLDIHLPDEIKMELDDPVLFMSQCPLPESGIKGIIDRFGITNLTELRYSFFDMTNINLTKQFFNGLNSLTKLDLSQNDMKNIDENAFEDLSELDTLSLNDNKVKLLPKMFESNTKLRWLEIGNNAIAEIPSGIFLNLSSLMQLLMWSNNLTKITNETFSGLHNLKVLELRNSPIQAINEDAFGDMRNLTTLILSDNKMERIPTGLFKNTPKLATINLSGLKNLQLDDSAFADMPSLEKLYVQRSGLKSVPKIGAPRLKLLDLGWNNIGYIPLLSFEELQTLKLGYNKIDALEDLNLLKNLEHLDLGHNELKEINQTTFQRLSNLKILNLANNQIVRLPDNVFDTVRNLEELLLSNNRFVYSSGNTEYKFPSPFNKLLALRILDLKNNSVEDFPDDFMTSATNLEEVDLSFNKLSKIHILSLQKSSRKSVTLNLENNKISVVDFYGVNETAMASYNETNQYNTNFPTIIFLANNPIKCDCNALGLVWYIRNRYVPIKEIKDLFDIRYDDLKCSGALFENISIADVKPMALTCQIPRNEFKCTDHPDRCDCSYRPDDGSLLINCARKKLSVLPTIFQPPLSYDLDYHRIEVNLEGNLLESGPSRNDISYENVTSLFLGGNLIRNFSWVPPRIEILDLENNKLNFIDDGTLKMLNSTKTLRRLSLQNNPLKCECAAASLTNYLRQNPKIVDTSSIRCHEDNKLLINMNEKNLCRTNDVILAISIVSIFVLFLISLFAAFYYRYELEIKIWLYSKGYMLWLVTEEELDKDKEYDAFISYSHKDEDFVKDVLVPAMEEGSNPYKLCIHERDWVPGENIATQVEKSVCNSRRTIVVLSEHFLNSVWGKSEFRRAHVLALKDGRTRVIIILLEDINEELLDDELKVYLKTNTYLKWGDKWFWDKLRYALPHLQKKLKSRKHDNVMAFIDNKFQLQNGDIKIDKPPKSLHLNLDAANLLDKPFDHLNSTPPSVNVAEIV